MKDKKIIIALIAFALVLVLTLVSTYAYFTATASGNENKTINVKTAQLGIEYAHGQKVELPKDVSNNLHANWDAYLPLEVESVGTVDQYFDIIWDTITTNTIVGNHNGVDVKSDFTWTLYKLPSAFNVEVEENTEEARAAAVRAAATLIESGTQETKDTCMELRVEIQY